jgi:dolichyl-phosphate beta-glucosyltransferase
MIKSLSIIIPFFNEEQRIQSCFKQIAKFNKKISTEFILVNDGSYDRSNFIVKEFLNKNSKNIKLLNLKKNMGKGHALKKGIQVAKKEWILTSDLDLSVPLNQVLNWIKKNYLKKNCHIYFGSRGHKKSIVKAKLYRVFLGKIFRFIINILFKIEITDTQCGYKLYQKKIAKKIFKKIKMPRFEHDLEIVLNAKKLNHSIIELPVKWIHKSNSKLNIFIDPIKMFLGILLLKYKWKTF